jgi:hypothetical protein
VYVTTMSDSVRRVFRVIGALAIATSMIAGSAHAQDDPNPGRLTFTGGLDVLPGTTYVFRGIVQEAEPKLTLWPYGDIGFALYEGTGGIKTVSANVGVWNSLHTGSSGSDSDLKIHYEEDFYAALGLGFGGGVALTTQYTAYTSPNNFFPTVKEISFKVAKSHMLNPYGLLAFELGGEDAAAADGGNAGTYLELGVGPTFPLTPDGPTLTIPLKLGLSVSDYYESPITGEDEKFGFFDIGALVTIPLGGIPSGFGSWNLHGGIDLLVFGDTTKAFNSGDGSKVVGLFGIGVSY